MGRRGGGAVKKRAKWTLAWGAFAFAVLGGNAATTFVIGPVITWGIGLFGPWELWVAWGLFAVAAAIVILDLATDWVPNRLAVYLTIVLPSLSLPLREGGGWISEFTRELVDAILVFDDRTISRFFGDGGPTRPIIAGVLIGLAILWAERYARSGNTRKRSSEHELELL